MFSHHTLRKSMSAAHEQQPADLSGKPVRAIAMSDFSWLERRWPGAGFEGWDRTTFFNFRQGAIIR